MLQSVIFRLFEENSAGALAPKYATANTPLQGFLFTLLIHSAATEYQCIYNTLVPATNYVFLTNVNLSTLIILFMCSVYKYNSYRSTSGNCHITKSDRSKANATTKLSVTYTH